MKCILPLVIILFPLAALGQSSVTLITEPVEAVVTVTKVDRKARTVTIRGPAGNLHTLAVPKEAQNLDQVKAGDRFRMTYAEAAAVALTKGGKAEAGIEEMVSLAPKGAKPGGYKVRTFNVSGVVEAIDYKRRQVSVRGPKGNILSLPVSAEVKNLESVSVGDLITVMYSEALAMEMVPPK
jgi:putative lipoic acid-binding regulatory protein